MQSDTKRKWSEETLETLEKLCLFDDDLMSRVFERNIQATEYLINTILEREDLHVVEVAGQKEYINPYFGGRVIQIDIYAQDAIGNAYDIEVQRANIGASPRRVRFHNAMMDVRMLDEKQKFQEIKDSYVIFITQNDVMGKGFPLYHIEKIVKETGSKFDDGAHVIFVNGAYKNDQSPIGRLVHDFGCVRAEDMYSDILRKQVQYFKEQEGGRTEMCELIEQMADKRLAAQKEEIIKEAKAEARAEAQLEQAIRSIKNIVKNAHMTVTQAMDLMGIPAEDRENIIENMKA